MEDVILENLSDEISKKYNRDKNVIKVLLILNKRENNTYEDSKKILEKFFKNNAKVMQ